MKIKKILKATLLLTLVFTMQSMTSDKGVVGTWIYEAPGAPYEYANGEIIIKKDKGIYSAEIKFEYESIEMDEITVEKNTVVLKFDIEETPIKIILKMEGDSMTGISETPDGELELTGKRK